MATQYSLSMQIDRSSYSIRPVLAADVEVVARQRALMFYEMGLLPAHEIERLISLSIPWLNGLIANARYQGWLAYIEDEVVAGAGVELREVGPVPDYLHVVRWGHVMNCYTSPGQRRRGLANLLLKQILHWSTVNQIDYLTLSASNDGRALYEAHGFTPVSNTSDMKLSFPLRSSPERMLQ